LTHPVGAQEESDGRRGGVAVALPLFSLGPAALPGSTSPPPQAAKPRACARRGTKGREGSDELTGAKSIALDLVDPSAHQARTAFAPETIDELAASIRERGVLQPVRVRPVGARYELVAGERRCRAARAAGLTAIPAIVVDLTPEQAFIENLVENLQREDLNVVDRANGLQQLRLNLGSVPWAEVGRRVGLSERRVLQLVDVTKLAPAVQQRVVSGTLTEKQTRLLKGLDARRQEDLAVAVTEQALTPKDTVAVARAMRDDETVDAAQAVARVRERAEHQGSVRAGETHSGVAPASDGTATTSTPPVAATGINEHYPEGHDDASVALLGHLADQLARVSLPSEISERALARQLWQRIKAIADTALASLAAD